MYPGDFDIDLVGGLDDQLGQVTYKQPVEGELMLLLPIA